MQIRSVGGAVNDVDPEATAYAHRTQNFALSAVGSASPAQRGVGRRMAPAPERALPELRHRPAARAPPRRLPGETLIRLRELKALYDPDNVFNQNFPITPADQLVSRR